MDFKKAAQFLIDFMEKDTKGEGTVWDKIQWFIAYQEAVEFRECSKLKDYALLFLNGLTGVKDRVHDLESLASNLEENYSWLESEEELMQEVESKLEEMGYNEDFEEEDERC